MNIHQAWVPFNAEAEEGLLGAILLNNDAHARVSEIVEPHHFGEPLLGHIFDVASTLIRMGKLANPITVQAFLPPMIADTGVKTKVYVARLAANSTTIVNAIDYAKHVRELADRRQIAEIARLMAPDAATEAVQLASEAIEQLDAIVTSRATTGAPSLDMRQAMLRAVDAAAKAYQMDGHIQGVPTTLRDLDHKLGGMSRGDLVVLGGRPGMGKMQPLHSPVLTPTGWSTMGEMRVGTTVVSQDGAVVPVIAVHPHGEQDVYRINFSDGRSTLVGLEHLWEVRSKHWLEPRIIDTREIMRLLSLVRYKKWLHVPLFSGGGLDDGALPVPPYTMGAWLGDGSVNRGMITKYDDYIFDRIRAEGYRVGPPNRSRAIYGLIGDLKKAGVAACHSWEKSIPPAYFMASKEQRTKLLNGLLDTDGTVEPSGTLRYCTSSKRLALDVQKMARSLGAVCKISEKVTSHRLAYILSIRHADAKRLITMPRKAERLPVRYQYDRLGLRIDSVEKAGREECQCITIDHPSGLYMTDDYIVTHNSACILTMLRRQAEQGFKSMLVSLEMSDVPMSHRMISDYIFDLPGDNLPYSYLRSGRFHERLFTQVQEAATKMAELPIRIEQQPGLTVSQIGARARQHKRRHGLDVLAVDHLDLVKASGRYAGNKVYELGETTAALKSIAKEMDIVVILLAQLSRDVEKREDKRPQLSDLRSSGSIEQDADTVIFLYRHAYYLAAREPTPATPEHELWQNESARCHNLLSAIVAKQRSGPTGRVELFCDISNNAIRDLSSDQHLPGER